jgi:hypothetical protein
MNELTISPSASFEEAIAFTKSLLSSLEESKLTELEIEQAITSLVQSANGARGFFVTYLTREGKLADSPSPGVIKALQSSPEIVSDLLVKNLAMSTAVRLTHQRQGNPIMAESSQVVTRRTQKLIQMLNLEKINNLLAQLEESVKSERGEYQDFLTKWDYDQEQLEAIAKVIAETKLV